MREWLKKNTWIIVVIVFIHYTIHDEIKKAERRAEAREQVLKMDSCEMDATLFNCTRHNKKLISILWASVFNQQICPVCMGSGTIGEMGAGKPPVSKCSNCNGMGVLLFR
jgi:hypothetical protein